MIAFIQPKSLSYIDPWTGQLFGEGGVEKTLPRPPLDDTSAPPSNVIHGEVIMQKLGNATAKAALGRATWKLMLCALHNEVNKRLQKPIFDCAHLDAEYDCGCGDEPVNKVATAGNSGPGPMDLEDDPSKDYLTGAGMIKGGR
ncbi:hypothetical protein DXG03_004043 [Asterophora parasitica]|uniref:thiol oxidase n=1 Tax=Asterophora parasitica TaxID=117018 RepID=A0A9P7G8X5_9AGAR|nr:hypothetical protein DXG03_004043 [Asterophora parasitica]